MMARTHLVQPNQRLWILLLVFITAAAESSPSVDSYVTGSVLMSGVYAQTQIQLLPKIPDIGQLTVEMQLFPGLWFSHAGQLVSVELVVQPYPESSLARVQILRPYCNPNHHLVPPGCSSLLNPFSCCSAVPLCNTTGGCSVGQYWCHLLEVCVPTSSPCSPYGPAAGARGFTLPPRYPEVPPFYHLVADFPLRINSSSQLQTLSLLLPDRSITVYPDDIVAVQHTRDSGSFLHCLDSAASGNSPWRQSYMSLRTVEWGGWWDGGLTSMPPGHPWVDGVVCDLRMLYVDNFYRSTETTTAPDTTPSATSEFGLNLIHPVPDENNQIHVQISVPTLIVVKVLSGEKTRSSWSAPVLQNGVSFFPFCPKDIAESCSSCKQHSHDAWFSSVTLMLPSVGLHTLNVSVMDGKRSESVSVKVWGYEAVTGLSVEPRGCNRMIIDTAKSFIAKVKTGSSVKFTWVIDNLENFAHEGESYSVVFKKPTEYKLTVTASNPVSSQTQQILLTADEMSPLVEPEFLGVREVVAVGAEHLYTLKVKVDISLPVTFRWDFGDGSSNIIHTQSAPCQTMRGLMEGGGKEVYVQDSVNYTYLIPDEYTLHVHISNQYDTTDISMKISVRPHLKHLLISSSPLHPLVNHTVLLKASTEPSSHIVVYTWDFGDASEAFRGLHRNVSHTFTSAGVYNVTVCANNTVTVLNTLTRVEVMEKISGLAVSYNGPSELGSTTEFRATVTAGTSLTWSFDFGDGSLQGNLTDGFISHVYKHPGNYTVDVTASNIVSQSRQSIGVEVYKLAVLGLFPTECVMSGSDVQLTALVNGNVSVLTFHWLFGDGSPPTVVRGQSTAVHTFQKQGMCHVSLTVFSLVSLASFNMSLCVEAPITNMTVQPSQEVVSVGEKVCFNVLVYPEQMSGCQFKWFSSPSGVTAVTGNIQTCFIFQDEGVEDVSVTASNNVSNRTSRTTITVQIPVSRLSVEQDIQDGTLSVNALASFWVASCAGSNVSVLWDFGDGSPLVRKQNVSHFYTSPGQFMVTVTAFNAISRESLTINVNVLLPIPDLSLHTNQPYAVVGEEILISAISSAIGSTTYYWTVDGITSTKQGTYQFRFAFLKPGVYRVRVVAQNLVSRKEAAVVIEVFERIEGLQIECQSLKDMKYVPTQQELLFFASITKGSNVTYQWLASQSGINTLTGDGEFFSVFAESPGRISVELTGTNRLGKVTKSVSLVAVQLVSGVRFTTQSHIVVLGKLVNISVSVSTGSDLKYLWYVDSDVSPLQTDEPFLLHTFASVGDCLVRVSVQNILSHSNVSKEFNVQEEIQEVDFDIQGKRQPFYISTSDSVQLHGLTQKGSDLHWSWTVRGFELFNASNQTFIYTFPRAGVYQVSLNVSNGVNWQMVSHSVTVEDAIQDLTLDISKSPSCTEEQVTFIPTISKGSNVSFMITFRNSDWIHSQGITEGLFTTSSIPKGTHLVTVKGWNQVSSAEVSSSIQVTEKIQDLRLVNCCSDALEALKEVQFKAEAQTGLSVNYTWTFYMVGSEPTRLHGQEVIFTPPDSGLLSVSVLATNGVCSRTVNDTVTVQWHVKKVKLICHSEIILVGHAVQFSAKANGGSNPRYLWDFGDSTEGLVTDLSIVYHTYYRPGRYSVTVKVLNSVSNVSTALHIEVEEPQCTRPQASLIQSQSTIFRSRQSFFEASVEMNCSAYKATYRWDIIRESDCTDITGNKVILRNHIDATSPLLSLPKCTLDTGRYCLVFTVSFKGTPLLVQRKTSITVVQSALVAVIKGGSHRLCPRLRDLVLDGSDSEDPDVEPGFEDTLQYRWSCMTLNSTESHIVMQPIGGNSSRVTVSNTQLNPNTVYIFTLTVRKAGREPASFTQTVSVSEAAVLPVIIGCVSCSVRSSLHHVSHTKPTVLSGKCEQCDDGAQFTWSAEDQFGVTLNLNEVSTSSGRNSPNVVVRSGVLQPGRNYTFTLTVSQPGREIWGRSSLMIIPNKPPHGGRCDLSPQSDIRLLETVVTYNCSGWRSDESDVSQLMYNFQVSPCQRTDCTKLTLYRGTRSTFGSLVPMGSLGLEGNTSFITVTLMVEDYLGSKAIALNRVLMVETPPKDEATSQWLRNKTQTELWALTQHGNPQEIIPFSIALTSQLNQMESGQTAAELMDRREIRGNVTRALASLPVSSLVDVDQISSVLSQSTAVPSELVCDQCQQKILESVEKMIHVLQEQSLGVSSAAETGRNILNIIGNTLASVSQSVDSSRSHSNTLQSASNTVLSALSHAGALMRLLMLSHIDGEEPLMLSTPHINTAGFHGDPSDLLCTSNQIETRDECLFEIPPSLAADLRGQRSELVQVLVAVDLGSNAALTAAEPPISTSLVGLEFTTPRGEPIPIQGLDPDRAIRVTLPKKQQEVGGANGTCLNVTLPKEGRLNLTVRALELEENAGLYIAFNFSLEPGGTPESRGHVRIDVRTNASQNSLVRELDLSLSAAATSKEETVFLSPLLDGTSVPLSVSVSSSVDGGPVLMCVCVFSSVCQYYSEEDGRWSSEGLRSLEGSTLQSARCLSRHLTLFGASLFLQPGAVTLLPPPDSPMRNVVVVIVCAVLVLIHLLVGLIAHKLDHLDSVRLSQVPMCGRSGLYHYRVLVKTGWRRGAGTTAHVGISLYGVNKSGARHLQREGAFQRNSLDQFHLETDDNLGEIWKIRIWHDNTGLDPSWFVQHVVVWDLQTDVMFFFLLEDWLSVENQKNGSVEKEVLASCPEELSQFGRVFSSQLMFGMVEHHLWLSLWQRPAHSRFTRGQRVTCSALTLHLYLALGALWFGAVGTAGHSGPVSARLLVDMETVAVGMTIAMLVFPLQWLLCFLFRKAHCRLTLDISVPPSPVCHSVEMDVYLRRLSESSVLSLPDSSGPVQDSPSSLLDSKALDSSILDFWAASGLAPRTDGSGHIGTWPSCDSLLNLPLGPSLTETTAAPNLSQASPVLAPARLLRRKKAVMHLDSPKTCTNQNISTLKTSAVQTHKLTTLLTLSEEDLLMSIAAAAEDTAGQTNSSSDSGRDSPKTNSSLSSMRSGSCSSSSWSEQSEDKSVFTDRTNPPSCPSPYAAGLYKFPSLDSVASTVLPSPSPDSSRCSSTTRIGIARAPPSWLLPPWAPCVIYLVVAVLLGVSLAVVGLYGSFLSRTGVLMWLISSLSAFFTSVLLLEPLKVCVQALLCTALWRPVDPEVEEHLAEDSTVVLRTFGEHGGKVRPPCGYGLLQAKEEARKIRALRSLMRHCVCQLLFLLLVLMVNYQDGVEQTQARLLHSAVRQRLHAAPRGAPTLTSITDFLDAERWINHTLVHHLHHNPTLVLVGSPRLQVTPTLGPLTRVFLGNGSAETRQVLADLHMNDWSNKEFKSLSVDFTHYHRESGLFVCVSMKLKWTQTQRLTPDLSIRPLLIPSSSSGLDLQFALTVLLILSALLILFEESWSVATEHAQSVLQCRRWFNLSLALLSLATAILQLCFLSQATRCVSKLRSDPDGFIDFSRAAVLAQRSSQCAAVLLTLLVLKLLGTLRFVRRWVVLGRVLHRAWTELWAVTVLLLLLLLLCTLLGNMLFSRSLEGFLSVGQSGVSVLSILRGRVTLHRLCSVHPVLGPLYGLLLTGGTFWMLARLCGAVLIQTYRTEQAELYHPTIEPQDYEMVELFIKRLKLWMGLTKAKEFRHRVKFEGMDVPPSRSSHDSRLSTLSSTLLSSRSPSLSSSFSSPRPPSSASDAGFDVQPYLDRLLPCVTTLLSRFEQVNQITEDVHNLETKLQEAQTRRRKTIRDKSGEGFGESAKPKEPEEETGEIRRRKMSLLYTKPRVSLPSSLSFSPSTLQSFAASVCRFPRSRSTHSESESLAPQTHNSSSVDAFAASGVCSLHPGCSRFPRRRAWHSGSSHSADAAQRMVQAQGRVSLCDGGGESLAFTNARPKSEEGVRRRISDGVPVKRKAWTEQD